MDDLKDKVALVTGAGAGIGRAIALRLAMSGANVGLFDTNAASASATAEVITALGQRAVVSAGDVSSRAEVIRGVKAIVGELGSVDILVNNAGILRAQAFLDVTEDDWRRMFAINLDGVFHFSQTVLPAMIARRSGSIVNVSSWTGKKGVPNHAAYGATKASIINLTQSLAGEFGSSGIRINAVCPGIIVDTEMRAEAEAMNRELGLPDVATRVQAIPLRRAGTPGEIAELVAFLASDRAAYMTGQAINVTGGHWMN